MNNVFAQIGLIMLIGLAAKNAILIVEFAKMEYDQGKPLMDAALNAAKLRFRPILMTAFAFILGVVPLLTASGAGAESRKVMGMTVFSGMLIATILGVLLDPDAVRAVEKMIGVSSTRRHRGGGAAAGTLADATRAGGALRCRVARAQSGLLGHRRVASRSAGCAVGPNYERPAAADAARHTGSSKAPTQAQSLADMPWFQVFDDPALQALIREAIANNLDLRVAVAHVEEARARAGIAKSYLYPQVDGAASYSVRGASTTTDENDDTTHQSGDYGFQLSWEIDLFGRLRREQEAAIALALASEQGRRGVLVTLVGDVATELFPAARARPAARRSRSETLAPQRRDGHLFPEPSRRRRVESSRARPDSGEPRADRRRDPGNRAPDRGCRECDFAAARAAARRRSRATADHRPSSCRRRFRRASRPRCSSAGPTSSRPSSCWSPPTPTSASRRRCSIRRSA